jgi:hydroxymethylpyrimidine/phosphomethylpyrimidine kinase
MTIAGSDSGGGAGVAADLKTFSALGVFGTCAITAVTAQNTQGVYEIFPVPPEVVERQIEVVLEDIGVDAVKTGMLYSRETMNVVSNVIGKHDLEAVVDPVLKTGTGSSLVKEEDLVDLIDLMTPSSKQVQAAP